jgi:hypothetical protein
LGSGGDELQEPGLDRVEHFREVGEALGLVPCPNKGLSSQRGDHWPPPPKTDMPQIRWRHEAEQV